MKRSPLRSKPKRLSPDERRERDHVLQRDGGCVLRNSPTIVGRCWGRPTYHHLRKAWKGRGYDRTNGVTLCEHHNVWVEDHPLVADTMGLVIREGYGEWDAWARMRSYGLPVGYEPEVEG